MADTNSQKRDKVETVEPEVIRRDGRPLYRLDKGPSQAVVIHCGDPRFQTAFRQFVTEELGIKRYTPVIIGGGVHAFGVQSLLPKNFKILWQQVKFAIKEHSINQVIVINHEDCNWYEKMRGYHTNIELPIKGKLDLREAATTIMRDFAGVHVRTFWAAIQGDNIVFSEVM